MNQSFPLLILVLFLLPGFIPLVQPLTSHSLRFLAAAAAVLLLSLLTILLTNPLLFELPLIPIPAPPHSLLPFPTLTHPPTSALLQFPIFPMYLASQTRLFLSLLYVKPCQTLIRPFAPLSVDHRILLFSQMPCAYLSSL